MNVEAALDFARKNITEKLFPGAAVAIGQNGRPALTRALGTLDGREAVTPETKYDLASMTKVVATTMVALSFLERGMLRLPHKISSFFDVPTDKQNISIEHLMTHTGGLPTCRIDETLGRRGYTVDEAVQTILKERLLFSPGTEVHYTCYGYILLGAILEHVGGAPLPVLAREIVFTPLGMADTGYSPVEEPCAPTGWDDDMQDHVRGVQYDRNSRYMQGAAGNAGVFSTVGDMVRFVEMLAGHGSRGNVTILKEETFESAIQNHTTGMSEARGLGFQLADGRNSAGSAFPVGSIGHTGSSGTGFYVDVAAGRYVVVLTNRLFYGRDEERILAFRRRFFDLAYWALEG